MSGWVKLHRSLLEWEWYTDLNTRTVFLHLLLRANYKDQKLRGETVARGSFPCGREQLAREIGISVQSLRTALNNLKSTGEVSLKSTSKGTIVTLCRYNDYQESATSELTNDQPAANQQVTTIERRKERKKVISRFEKPTVEDISVYGKEKGMNQPEAEKFFDFYESKNWMVGKNKMKCWKAAVRNWMRGKKTTPDHHTSVDLFKPKV